MEREMISLNNKVDDILDILRGNPLNVNDSGMIGKVNDMDERLEKLEKLKNKILWILVGISLPGGIGVAKILGAIAEAIHK